MQGELSDKNDLNEAYLRELCQARAGGSPASPNLGPSRAPKPSWVKNTNEDNNRAARQSMVENSHPVYSLMTSNPNRVGKKIVIPPPGAY